jgi:hypothetical protein
MQNDNNFDFDVNLQDLTHEQLVDLVKRLHVSVKRAQTFESTTSGSSYNSFNSPNTQPLSDPIWIRAEVDYPYDRDNGNNFTVLAYDQTMHNIGIRNRHEFKGKCRQHYHCMRVDRCIENQIRNTWYIQKYLLD